MMLIGRMRDFGRLPIVPGGVEPKIAEGYLKEHQLSSLAAESSRTFRDDQSVNSDANGYNLIPKLILR